MSRRKSRKSGFFDGGILDVVAVFVGIVVVIGLINTVLDALALVNWELVSTIGIAVVVAFLAIGIMWKLKVFRISFLRKQHFAVRNLNDFLRLNGTEFEKTVAEILDELGFRDVKHHGGSGDLQKDIQCQDEQGLPVMVQCKRYDGNRIVSKDMQAFIGMLSHHKAQWGIYVTTSAYTKPAMELAKDHNVILVDAHGLVKLDDYVANGFGMMGPKTASEAVKSVRVRA
jgi:restriction system protein